MKAMMVATSPSQFSVGSSISISSINSPETLGAGNSSLLPSMRNMAQSVHVADGLLRHMESHRRQQRSKQLQKPAKRRASKAQHCCVYTPTMATGSQPCFTPINFGDFDEKGWVRFQHELARLVDLHIRDGKWRQDKRDTTSGIAMSCPRF